MSRPRHYAKQAEAKRQVPQDDDSEQFEWTDAEQPEWDDVSGYPLQPKDEGEQQ